MNHETLGIPDICEVREQGQRLDKFLPVFAAAGQVETKYSACPFWKVFIDQWFYRPLPGSPG